MPQSSYDDRLFCSLYDSIVEGMGSNKFELEFWDAVCKWVDGPVMEIGCGTGRVLLHLANRGFTVHGIDSSVEMLNILRKKIGHLSSRVQRRVTIENCDMVDLVGEAECFSLVLFAASQFAHLRNDRERSACLRRCCGQLKDGGVVVISNSAFDKTGANAFVQVNSSGFKGFEVWTRSVSSQRQFRREFLVIPLKGSEGPRLFRWVNYPCSREHIERTMRRLGIEVIDLPRHISGKMSKGRIVVAGRITKRHC